MLYRLILPAICLPPLLICCAPSQPAIEAAPPAVLVRPPCSPPHELMIPPPALAALAQGSLSESQAVDAWIDDITAYQVLRQQTQDLQSFIQSDCQ